MLSLIPFYYLYTTFHVDIKNMLRSYKYFDNTPSDTKDRYFYHPDHLGSSSWITDRNGNAIQHFMYLPFGEDWIQQKTTSWSAPYTFSGKEKDAETGYGYFGARYYDSGLSIWLSVDPKSDKGPSFSPYNFCFNNPVIYIDPDGKWSQPIHNQMIERAVHELVKEGVIKEEDANQIIKDLKTGSANADSFFNGNQKVENSYIHYMKDPKMSTTEGQAKAEKSIKNGIEKFKKTGDFITLGIAAHTAMDKNCPTHTYNNGDGTYDPRPNNLSSIVVALSDVANGGKYGYAADWIQHVTGDNNISPAQMTEGVNNVKEVIKEALNKQSNTQNQQGKGVGLIEP